MIRPYYLRDDEDDCQCVRTGMSERHDEMYECRECGKCCADEMMLSNSWDSYEDKGICVQCAMDKEGLTVDELVSISNQTY